MAGEWSLAAFTLLGELAVGIHFFIGGLLVFGWRGQEPVVARSLLGSVVLAELGLMTAAALVSFFHLHHPFRAYAVLRNLRKSWLSREILFELAFTGALAALVICFGEGIGTPAVVRGLFVIGAAAGALFIGSMAGIYLRTSVPAWRDMHTPLSFGLAGPAMGAAAAAAFFRRAFGTSDVFRLLAVAALLLVSACLIETFAFTPVNGLRRRRIEAGLRTRGPIARSRHAAGIALLLGGAVLIAAVLAAPAVLQRNGLEGRTEAGLLAGAFVLVVAGESLGRLHFYGAGAARP